MCKCICIFGVAISDSQTDLTLVKKSFIAKFSFSISSRLIIVCPQSKRQSTKDCQYYWCSSERISRKANIE